MTSGGEPIPYAMPTSRPANRAWAGAAIAFSGLALIVLGGCFLIGVLSIVKPGFAFNGPTPPSFSSAEMTLMGILYLLAFMCFAGGAWVIVIGIRGLLKVLRS